MTIIADAQEKIPIFHEKLDGTESLIYDASRGWSYDFHITTKSGQEIRVERKSWKDYVSSWIEGRLDRQCSYVDCLLLEYSDLDVDMSDQVQVNAMNHSQTLCANMWVVRTMSPEHSISTMRYLERRGDTHVRENGIKMRTASPRWMLMQAIRQINPWRELTGGRLLGDEIERVVDWEMVARGFRFDDWREDIQWKKSRAIPKKHLESAYDSIVDPNRD